MNRSIKNTRCRCCSSAAAVILLLLLLMITKETTPTTTTTNNNNCPKYRFKNVLFEGGLTKSLSYLGSLKALQVLNYYENNAYKFNRIAGTSGGCMFALFVALDIDPSDIESLIFNPDINVGPLVSNFDYTLLNGDDINKYYEDARNSSTPFWWFGAVYNSYNLITKASAIIDNWLTRNSPGLSTGQALINFIRTRVYEKSPHKAHLLLMQRQRRQQKKNNNNVLNSITFKDLQQITNHELVCFASRISSNHNSNKDDSVLNNNGGIKIENGIFTTTTTTGATHVEFSATKTPNESILKALYASLTIPTLFKPLDDGHGNFLISGGFINNFPITYNDDLISNKISETTLGFKLGKRPVKFYELIKTDNNNDRNEEHNNTATTTTVDDNSNSDNNIVQQTTTTDDLKNNNNDNDNDNNNYYYEDAANFSYKEMSTFEYATALYSLMVSKNYYNDKDDNDGIIERDRVIYLESSLNDFDTILNITSLTVATNTAFRKTIDFIRNIETLKPHNQRYIGKDCSIKAGKKINNGGGWFS